MLSNAPHGFSYATHQASDVGSIGPAAFAANDAHVRWQVRLHFTDVSDEQYMVVAQKFLWQLSLHIRLTGNDGHVREARAQFPAPTLVAQEWWPR